MKAGGIATRLTTQSAELRRCPLGEHSEEITGEKKWFSAS